MSSIPDQAYSPKTYLFFISYLLVSLVSIIFFRKDTEVNVGCIHQIDGSFSAGDLSGQFALFGPSPPVPSPLDLFVEYETRKKRGLPSVCSDYCRFL